MNFFLDLSIRPKEENTFMKATPAYVELQKHSVDPPGVSHFYVLNWDQYSFLVAACLGHELDGITPYLQDPKMGKAFYAFYKEKWPTWGRLIENSVNSRYSEGALLNIEDPDDGERKWVVGTVVGNILVNTVEELEKVMLSERMMEAYVLVFMTSVALAQEWTTRPNPALGMVKLYARGIFQSYMDAIDLGSVWVPKIVKLFGG